MGLINQLNANELGHHLAGILLRTEPRILLRAEPRCSEVGDLHPGGATRIGFHLRRHARDVLDEFLWLGFLGDHELVGGEWLP